MLQYLIAGAPILLAGLTLFYLCAFLGLMKLFQKDSAQKLPLMMAALVFGLFYDALVLVLGAFLGEGKLLKVLSVPRYVLHGMLIPLMLDICAEALEAKKGVVRAVAAVSGILALLGAVAAFKMKLNPLKVGRITRYVSDNALTPKWATTVMVALSIVPTVILISCGAVLWKKKGKKELTLSGLLMLAGSAIGPAVGAMDISFLFSMFGEFGMILYFWLYAKNNVSQ